jgi:SAM-dependent methyltransferase
MAPVEEAFDARSYWENRLLDKWGLHGVGHISYGTPYNEWLYRVRKHVFLRNVRKLPVDFSTAAVLDVGSGTGFWLKLWRSLGVPNVVGSDLTNVAVQHLRRENPGMEIRQLDIADSGAVGEMRATFDLISAFDVLFHITDEQRFRQALGNIVRLLRPGGFFLFSDSLLHHSERRTRHEVDRSLDEYVRQLHAHGLQIRSRVPIFVLMNTPIDSSSKLLPFLWRLFMSPMRVVHTLGHAYGATLYPIELALTKIVREGPSTEMLICQKFHKDAKVRAPYEGPVQKSS